MVEENYWVASDTGPAGTLVAVSRVISKSKAGLPSGEFLNALIFKHHQKSTLNTPALHQLVYESHSLFRRAQIQQKQALLKTDDIMALSLEYRSVIRSALSCARTNDDDVYASLSSWELIWSLIETIFLKPSASSIVADLVTWARTSLVRTDHVDEISNCLRPSRINEISKRMFWDQVTYFIFGGLFANASLLLKTYHDLIGDPSLSELAEILDHFDVSAFCTDVSEGDLLKLQKNVRALLASGRLKKDSETGQIAMLIMGHLPTLKAKASFCSGWFELMPLYALLCRPTAAVEDLPEIARECAELFGNREENGFDLVMSAVCSLDPLLAIQQIAKTSPNWWLAAHLSDLLQKANSSLMNICGVDARQHIVMEYGTQLFDEPSMWLLGFDYLVECGEDGRERLELLLSRLWIDNEAMALKLISRCSTENFEDLICDLERSFALRYLSSKQWSSALIWGMRTEDPKLLDTIANCILSRCPPDLIARISVLEEMNETTLLSPSLIFLHKYYNFRKLFDSAQKEAAASYLIDLIVSGRAPERLRYALFNDLAVILSFDGDWAPLLDKDTTYKMLHYLSIFEAKKLVTKSVGGSPADFEESVIALRLSLLNNFCKNCDL